MEMILFVVVVAAVAVVGVTLGLAVALHLTRWDERRSRAEVDGPAVGEGETDRD